MVRYTFVVAILAAAAYSSSSLVLHVDAFSSSSSSSVRSMIAVSSNLSRMTMNRKNDDEDDEKSSRRAFLERTVISSVGGIASSIITTTAALPLPAYARVYLDPAMYGDQELRVSAVDSLRESVRRALLQKPGLAPYFLELALLDSLSYSVSTNEGGPDGSIIKAVLATKGGTPHSDALLECATVLLEAKKNLRKLSSITIADAVALAGAEAVAAVGGPVLPTQLGRTDAAPKSPIPSSMPPLNLLTGEVGPMVVYDAFKTAGLTEREMTALLGCLLSIDTIEKATPEGDWKANSKPKFREAGKMGRMSEFKALTDEDIESELAKDGAASDDEDGEESYTVSGDDGWYIADTFGSGDDKFGKRISKDKPELSRALRDLVKVSTDTTRYGWIATLLLSKDLPTAQSWVNKYGSKPLLYEKDLKVAYNALTQLGVEYTGGKYESLLKNKKRKTLNDDDLDFLR
jgi:L-ascorbate peroxidase